MTLVRHDYLPEVMTPGEMAAIADATEKGWIVPPLYCSLKPEPPRAWRSAHLRYLERRGLIGQRRHRLDGMWCIRLNAEGLKLRDSLRQRTNRRELYAVAGVMLPEPERLAA